MKLSTTFAMTALVAMLGAGAAGAAQTAAPKTAAPAKAATSTTMAPAMDKSAISKKCSDEADKKGLHGAARKKFRSTCKADAKKM